MVENKDTVFDFAPAEDKLIIDVFWDHAQPRDLDLTIALEPLTYDGAASTRVIVSYVDSSGADTSQSTMGQVFVLKGVTPDALNAHNIAVNTTRAADWKAARARALVR